jgi:Protein of unknown function (DUF5818)
MIFRLTSLGIAFLIGLVSLSLGQRPQYNEQNPEDSFTARELIAWSSLQKPQPAPQPLPPRDTPIPQPDQPKDDQARPPADPQNQQSPAQSFSGRIVKDGDEYVLKATANTTYELDDQSGAKKYEDMNVRVIGNLDPGTNKIHVVKIELMS